MDRIRQALPRAMTLAAFALAVLGLHWATGGPATENRMLAASNAAYLAAHANADRHSGFPRRIAVDDSAKLAASLASITEQVRKAAAEAPSAETAGNAGPSLTLPATPQPSNAAAAPLNTDLPAEMPLADTSSATDQPTANENSVQPALSPTAPIAAAPESAVPQFSNEGAQKSSETPSDDALGDKPSASASDSDQPQWVVMERIAQQADRKTRHGFELAERGAYFAARSEFIGALRLIAEGLDAQQKTDSHSRALSDALTAIKEVGDFLPDGAKLETNVNLSSVIATHATGVLKNDADRATPMTAMRSYLTFAQNQLAAAVEHEAAGSMALHAMGKLHATLAQKKNTMVVAAECKAVAFFQAALLAYPENGMAANDLGVLLAKCGNYADARKMLEYSLKIMPQATSWHNLAVVYRQLNQPALADQAERQSREIAARRISSPVSANGLVRWVDPQGFSSATASTNNTPMPPPARTASRPNWSPAMAYQPSPSVMQPSPWHRPAGPAPAVAPAAGIPAESPWPAPTPAAAMRQSWGASGY